MLNDATNNASLEDYYRLLGKILVEFNQLEHLMSRFIVAFLEAKKDETWFDLYCVISHLSFEDKIRVLTGLCSRRLPNYKKEFKKIFEELREIQKTRNDYFHSNWSIDTYDEIDKNLLKFNYRNIRGKTMDLSLPPDLSRNKIFISKQDLKLFLKDIKRVDSDLSKLMNISSNVVPS